QEPAECVLPGGLLDLAGDLLELIPVPSIGVALGNIHADLVHDVDVHEGTPTVGVQRDGEGSSLHCDAAPVRAQEILPVVRGQVFAQVNQALVREPTQRLVDPRHHLWSGVGGQPRAQPRGGVVGRGGCDAHRLTGTVVVLDQILQAGDRGGGGAGGGGGGLNLARRGT